MLSKTKGIIANSAYTAELVSQLNPSTKIYTLPLGVDIDRFFPITKNFTAGLNLLTVARFEAFKGHDDVLEILSSLPVEIQESITWNIVGNGKYREEFMQKVANLNATFQVNSLGFVEESELPKIYQNADVFILCTQEKAGVHHVEGFGLVFLEAQASGLPVIAKPTGGISSAVEHLNGAWLFKENLEIVELLVDLHHNPEQITKMGKLARKRVETRFSWESYCKELNKILQN
jgi:phosphatidylinositol alpha-1,6-mannosyltransferase